MQHIQTKNELLLQILENRLKGIQQIAKDALTFNPTSATYEAFYEQVAYFVHAIIKDAETRALFSEILQYRETLLHDNDYLVVIEAINQTMAAIATSIDEFSEASRLDEGDRRYGNAQLSPVTLKSSQLRRLWLNFDANYPRHSGNLIDDYLKTTHGLAARMVTDLIEFIDNEKLVPVGNLVKKLEHLINRYDYFENFEYGYRGGMAGEHLAKIYITIHPAIYHDGGMYHYTQEGLIKEKQGFLGPATIRIITADCGSIFNYIKDKLYTQLSIENYVERFITYVSLYYIIDFKENQAEKAMQKKFEEFLFNAGYYPVSEMQIKNGRLDTIAVNENNAFLFELKQVDLGKTEEDNVFEKLSGAQIQSSIYMESLTAYPKMNHQVFIILFTNRKVSFKNNTDRIIKDGITFIFKSSAVYDETASNIRQDIEIDIQDMIAE
jgi:hypothetical protein